MQRENSIGKKEWLIIGAIIVVLIAGFVFRIYPRAKFEVSDIKFSPSKVFTGEKVTIFVDVRNVGNAKGVYEATLIVNGIKVESKSITLEAGETKTVSFELVRDVAGDYTIEVGQKKVVLEVNPRIFLGAYIEYEVKGLALIIPISGLIRLEVINITEENYTVLMTPTNISGLNPETKTYRFDEPAGPGITENMTYVGEEYLSTAIGTRKVLHYYYENATEGGITKTNIYLDKDSKLMLLYQAEGSGFWLKISVSDTNMEWLKRRNP